MILQRSDITQGRRVLTSSFGEHCELRNAFYLLTLLVSNVISLYHHDQIYL